jgi:hypothetical protein
MSTSNPTDPPEFAEVLSKVRAWSPRLRLALARRVLEGLEAPAISEPPKSLPIDQVFGLLKAAARTPSDDECDRIVEEEGISRFDRR